ncbi:MAG: MgtC/SapB family protein [Reichenbachiella sp.]|uniref:MgtC/SapB family protein n=1 Tax=Reichenbachiella sp. TaxID=2184521 RepID=UPI0032633E5B
MAYIDFIISLAVAAAAGMVIGFERQWQNKSAGLRTNTLVAMGAALYVLLSIQLTEEIGDVTRIIGQVVTGIGFLGAGIIFKEGANVYGLTTAATVWCSSAIGCLAGAGFYVETWIATLAILIVHLILTPFNKLLNRRK